MRSRILHTQRPPYVAFLLLFLAFCPCLWRHRGLLLLSVVVVVVVVALLVLLLRLVVVLTE